MDEWIGGWTDGQMNMVYLYLPLVGILNRIMQPRQNHLKTPLALLLDHKDTD